MDEIIKKTISIPSDENGYLVLKCPSCGEKFGLLVEDIGDTSTLRIWCPGCGLVHDSYLDDDVSELIKTMAYNLVADLLNDFNNDLEKMSRNNSMIRFKADKPIKKKAELAIGRKTGDYEEVFFICCSKKAMLRSLRKFQGGYCPFCGEMNDGN